MPRLVVSTALLLALGASTAGCGGRHPPAERHAPKEPAVAVEVVPAHEAAAQVGEEVVGTIRSREQASIAAELSGNVRKVHVELGDRVGAGDVLVEIASRETGAQVNQARASFEAAELHVERMRKLAREGAISEARLEEAEARYRVRRAALAEARVMHGHSVLRAPFAGVITAKDVDVGDLAVPGRPLLEVERPGDMRLEAFVPEALVDRVSVGTKLPVRVDALGRELEGTVVEVSPSAEPSSRSVLVKLDLPQGEALRSGMFGSVVIPTGEDVALSIPQRAVVERGQIETVFLAKGGTARMRIVRTGRERDGSIEIVSGLSPGEKVVVSHPERLVDGQPITVRR